MGLDDLFKTRLFFFNPDAQFACKFLSIQQSIFEQEERGQKPQECHDEGNSLRCVLFKWSSSRPDIGRERRQHPDHKAGTCDNKDGAGDPEQSCLLIVVFNL